MTLLLSVLLRLIAVLACPSGPGPVPACPPPRDLYHGRHRVHIGGTHA